MVVRQPVLADGTSRGLRDLDPCHSRPDGADRGVLPQTAVQLQHRRAGIVGISVLSVMVWAHHMYASGWAPNLNGAFMLTTEMISIPTGMLFLVILGTIWRGRIWTRLPMMSTYAMLWNFIIGGITGLYLSDVPVDYALHGSMFV